MFLFQLTILTQVGVIMTIVSDKERGSNKDFDDYIR